MTRESSNEDRHFFRNPQAIATLFHDHVPETFVRELDLARLEPCKLNQAPTQVPGHVQDQVADQMPDALRKQDDNIVWRIGWKEDNWLYLALSFEILAAPDPYVPMRAISRTMLALLDMAREQVRQGMGVPLVFPIVVFPGKRPWKTPLDTSSAAPGSKLFHSFVLDTQMERAPEEHMWLLGILLDLERPEYLEEFYRRTERELQKMEGKSTPTLESILIQWILGNLKQAGLLESIPNISTSQELMDMLETNFVLWEQKFVSQGEQRGRELGARSMLLRMLTDRFGPLPKSLEAYVKKASRPEDHLKLVRMSCKSNTLDEFLDQLDAIPGYLTYMENK